MDALINERVSASFGIPKARQLGRIELVPVQIRDVLNLRRLPARLTVQQTAAVLNCGEHDVPVLVSHGLLKPLGHPSVSAVKYFAPTDVLELAGDRELMGQICDTIYEHWRGKNAAKMTARAPQWKIALRKAQQGSGHPKFQPCNNATGPRLGNLPS